MKNVNIFSSGVLPLVAAALNGAAVSYIFNITIPDEKKIKIPIIGKINIIQFFIGVGYEALLIFALVPFRDLILATFYDGYDMDKKWDAYVLITCIFSIVLIGMIVSFKFFIVRNNIARTQKAQAKRDKDTINNLTEKK